MTFPRVSILLGCLLLTGCFGRGDGVMVEDTTDTVEISQPVPPAGAIAHPEHGTEMWFAIGAMSATGDVPANGMAESHVFADGASIASVHLNIAVPPEGMFYEAWLIGPDYAPFSLGHLTNPFGDVRHQVRFEGAESLEGRLQVQVTLERDDGNPGRGSLMVAEGTLKVQQR